jgi:hypothetical protein
MCLQVAGRIVEIRDEPGGARTANVEVPAGDGAVPR